MEIVTKHGAQYEHPWEHLPSDREWQDTLSTRTFCVLLFISFPWPLCIFPNSATCYNIDNRHDPVDLGISGFHFRRVVCVYYKIFKWSVISRWWLHLSIRVYLTDGWESLWFSTVTQQFRPLFRDDKLKQMFFSLFGFWKHKPQKTQRALKIKENCHQFPNSSWFK